MESREILEAELAKFVGQTPWGVTGSRPTGSDFSLKFGARLQRPPTKSGKQRVSWYGSFTLFVVCSWRLEQDDVPILASGDHVMFNDATPADGRPPFTIVAGLDPLIGRSVQNVALGRGFDVEMDFGSGLVLFVFCDRSAASEEPVSLSYELRTPEKRLFVRYSGSLTVHTELDDVVPAPTEES